MNQQRTRRIFVAACVTAAYLAAACLSVNAADQARPNVILFIGDDISWDDFGCYGNTAARTPNIDRLAKNGLRFTEAYLTASSCSPSRSSIITGRYPHNNGKAAELHQPIAWNLPWFPALLRDAGYYTALVGKHHMTSAPAPSGEPNQPTSFDLVDPSRVQGNNGGHANWVKTVQNRPKEKPFFFWFAAYDAHRGWEVESEWDEEKYGPKHRPEDIIVPPFLSDDPETRRDLVSYYNEVTRYDYYIGQVTNALDEQGELDNTLILVMADNGRPFPRAKTRLHDSGMKTALVAHWPNGIKNRGASCNSLVSAIDLAPTILKLAGVDVPDTMQGVDVLPLFDDSTATVRKVAFSEHNWHDYEAHGRSLRMDGYLYIRNFRPHQMWQGPADSVRSPAHTQLKALRDAKKLTAAQADVFLNPRPADELYDVSDDPNQLKNLASDPEHAEIKQRLEKAMERWMDETGDSVPTDLSQDSFDRESGNQIHKKEKDYRGTTPGEDRNASTVNAPGPR